MIRAKTSARGWKRAATALVGLLAGLSSCAQVVQYTDELTDSRTGRTIFVRTPATLGGVVGFVAGIPVDIVALPVTYLVYSGQRQDDALTADPLSTILFPSFVLWRAGTLVALPFDAVEHLAYRNWRPPPTPTTEEQEAFEVEQDEVTLPQYPVKPIFPVGGSDR